MFHHHFTHLFNRAVRLIEYTICIFIALGVCAGFPNLFSAVMNMFHLNDGSIYTLMSGFLRQTLLLVVGLELIIMILTHSQQALLTLTLFVIARKMLVYADGMLDIFIGVVSIAVIFAVIRFLASDKKLMAGYDRIFSAAIPLKKLRLDYNYHIPESEKAETLGGLVYQLLREQSLPIEEKQAAHYGNYIFTLHTVSDGVIEQVRIDAYDDLSHELHEKVKELVNGNE